MASGSGHGRYACFEDEKRYPPPSCTAEDIFLSVPPPAQPGLRALFPYLGLSVSWARATRRIRA